MAEDRLKAQDRPSEEILNAFVDGEFSPEDRLQTLQAIASSEHLSREVCDMHQLKELVAMAYEDVEPPARDYRSGEDDHGGAGGRSGGAGLLRSPRGGPRRTGWFSSVAAGVVALVLGSVAGYEVTRDAGWFVDGAGTGSAAHATASEGQGVPELDDTVSALFTEMAEAESAGGAAAPQPVHAASETDQILLHVNDADRVAMEELLDDIEAMFDEAARDGRNLNVQVVVHNKAMNMLRADRAPFPDRVATLSREHSGLRFTACSETLGRLAREEGKPRIDILPQAERIDSGVAEAARRQAEGWIYIKV
ncbi:hypothetical protein [Thioalkalivibrio sp. AKL17]|uniref:DsrE family protein n=1 Tax=Thioalkalivibrio sp. AKL17 TaxID=1158160 RepID=UPI000361B829|nr:hypothetical protein [Thioalkalivibrio sp. AKL17]